MALTKKSKKRSTLQIVGLVAFLVVFPIISFLFLYGGFSYQKGLVDRLQVKEDVVLPIELKEKIVMGKMNILHQVDIVKDHQAHKNLMEEFALDTHIVVTPFPADILHDSVSYVLTDWKGGVRRVYSKESIDSKETMNDIIDDIVHLLPRKKRADIEFRRNKEL